MMSIRMTISKATRQALQGLLDKAYRYGDRRLVRRVTALLSFTQNGNVCWAAEVVGAVRESVYVWMRLLLEKGVDGLELHQASGRPPRLTKTQKQRLIAALEAGPAAAGFVTACWTALLVQQWIEREFGVL